MVVYIVTWPKTGVNPRSPSRFATWDGVVVDATPALTWAMGKSFETVASRLRDQYGAETKTVPDSYGLRIV